MGAIDYKRNIHPPFWMIYKYINMNIIGSPISNIKRIRFGGHRRTAWYRPQYPATVIYSMGC